MRELDKYFDTEEFQEAKRKYLKRNKKNYQIPQGSSISAVYANVYMVDFDKKINDFITSHHGMYRRYCDDIVMIIPMTNRYIRVENQKQETLICRQCLEWLDLVTMLVLVFRIS